MVGRKNDCDLRIPLTSVSRQHCEIEVADDQIKVRDLGSSNGTYYNSTRVQEAALSAGDEIVIGPVVFTVVVDGQPEDIKPVRTIVDREGSQAGDADPSQSDSAMPLDDDDEDLMVPAQVEDEASTPTVDLDDPLAGLAGAAGDGDDIDSLMMLDDDDDDDDDDDELIMLDDSEELPVLDDDDSR